MVWCFTGVYIINFSSRVETNEKCKCNGQESNLEKSTCNKKETLANIMVAKNLNYPTF